LVVGQVDDVTDRFVRRRKDQGIIATVPAAARPAKNMKPSVDSTCLNSNPPKVYGLPIRHRPYR